MKAPTATRIPRRVVPRKPLDPTAAARQAKRRAQFNAMREALAQIAVATSADAARQIATDVLASQTVASGRSAHPA